MRPTSAVASRFSQLLFSAATLASIACDDTTAPVAPTTLAFTVQVASAISGRPFSPAVKVAIQDASGNTVTTATNSITVAIGTNAGNGNLSGSLTAAAVNGVVTFANLSIDKAGSGYTLTATSPSLTGATTVPFAVVAGTAVNLGFTIQPVTTLARSPIPTFSVAVQDAAGNTVTGAPRNISLAIGTNPGGGGFFSGPTSLLTAVNGVATFSNVSISSPGTGYTLTAFATNLTSATSSAFNVTIGPATELGFIVQPVTTSPGSPLNPAVEVAVQDVAGNTITTATNTITVAIGANAGSGTLSGTTTVAAVNGVATFSDLSINNAGENYTLTATTGNLDGASSARFSIRVPLAFATVTAGYFHSCGVTTGGAAYCWGANGSGQQGNGGTSDSRAPVAVSGGLTFAIIGAGRTHTCAVTTGGVAYCWGDNQDGKLGTDGLPTVIPTAVSGGLTFASAIAGYSHSCGVSIGGAGLCWGNNASGAVGNGTLTAIGVPVVVSGGLTFASISPGRFFTCGLTTGGAAYCWGDNSTGELGDGGFANRSTPGPVSGQLNFALVSAGGFHACGLTTAGVAYCWGANGDGQLGSGTAASSSDTPLAVSGGLTFATLSAGNRHTCGVTTGGVAYCWGENSPGHLGDGTTNSRSSPVAVAGGLTFASVSAGRFHTCGVTTSGAAYCWGDNSSGALGDGTVESRLVPVPVR